MKKDLFLKTLRDAELKKTMHPGLEGLFTKPNTYGISIGSENLNLVNPTAEAVQTESPHEFVTYMTASPNYPKCPLFESVNAEGGKTYTVYLVGTIGRVGDYSEFMNILSDMTDQDTIYIHVDSPGGNLYTGAAISSLVENCKGHTCSIACGLCASAGSLIWAAAKEQIVTRFTTVMYHMSSHFDYGNSIRIRSNADLSVRYVQKKCLQKSVDKGYLLESEMNDIMNKHAEVWIGYSELLSRLGKDISATEHFKSLTFDDTEHSSLVSGLESVNSLKYMHYSISDLNQMDTRAAILALNSEILCGSATSEKDVGRLSVIRNSANKYTIVLDADQYFWNEKFLLSFARTMDKLSEDDELHILLPGGIKSYVLPYIGILLSSLERCKARTITTLTGCSSFGDIAIWLFGKDRQILNYGQRTLDSEIVQVEEWMKYRGEYVRTIIDRAVEVALITKEQALSFLNDKQNIILDL